MVLPRVNPTLVLTRLSLYELAKKLSLRQDKPSSETRSSKRNVDVVKAITIYEHDRIAIIVIIDLCYL